MIGRTDLWHKDAVIYSLDVEMYQDGNGDGIGDFQGLTRRLDHLVNLGATCVWLLPFFPSPNRDNGYDVTDYYSVDPRLGTLGDFVDFAQAARRRGIRIIIDLVVNHTSDQHPWFQAARQDPDSKYRNYYVWSETKPDDAHEGVVFPGEQESIWTYDRSAKMYYMHRFYSHQPDLNVANPEVRDEIRKIMGFWLELGVSGFRIDAAPFLIEHKGIDPATVDVDDPYAYIDQMREFLQWRKGDAILLAEANVPMEEIDDYFGGGKRMHVLFHFMANQHLYLALVRGEARPLARGLRAAPAIPDFCQWAMFVRNHDELDLGRLTDGERQEVFAEMAPTEDMRLFDRGIRRRFPPMVNGDRRRVELAYSLLFSLPGTPVLWYGEEIGMGDDLSLEGRTAVRTSMQWTPDRNAGFSSAAEEKLARPVIDEGPYRYECVNVRDQERDPDSLLNWFQGMIRRRRECPEWGWGDLRIIDSGDPHVLVHSCEWQGATLIAIHNMSGEPRTISLDLAEHEGGTLVHLLTGLHRDAIRRAPIELELDAYGYRWLRIGEGEGTQSRERA